MSYGPGDAEAALVDLAREALGQPRPGAELLRKAALRPHR